MKDLEAEIRDVSFKAEERIEMALTAIYLPKDKDSLCITASLLGLHEIFNEALKQTDYLKNELINYEYQLAKGKGSTSSHPDLQRQNITVRKISKNTSKLDSRMVGCEEEFMRILDQFMPHSGKQRQVVSIIGMGGIGKTTLAHKVYEDPSITCHFDMRAWVTVSQEYNVGQMLRCLIGCARAASSDEQSKDQAKLAESLHKHLKGQRYLIVIDDIWSTIAWDSVQRCFPDDNNGSRILLTSRLKEVAEYASSGNSPINLPFLDANQSWNLYCRVLSKTDFPFEFEQIGRDIVKKCEGLPLPIIVVASLLSKIEGKVEEWKSVAQNVIGDSNDACFTILSLSYNHLPRHLKACFLYFGVFPEDYEIPVKKLVRLWAAEGFLRVVEHRNMEEVGMECLQDLVDRSLVLVGKQSYNGKMRTIRMHDLLRDLCLREVGHENLLNVVANHKRELLHHSFSKPCRWIRIRGDANDIIDGYKCWDKFHSLHGFDYNRIQPFLRFKLLRVVDIEHAVCNSQNWLLKVIANLVHLRYFTLCTIGYAARFNLELFEHWSMQSFTVRGNSETRASSASGIWKMPLLRNICFDLIVSFKTSELEELNISMWFDVQRIPCRGIPWESNFLPNLKKLKLFRTWVPWSDMRLIGMLPNLEVLKLLHAMRGNKWEPSDGGFSRLKRLVIAHTSLQYWNATGDHFPMLECLELCILYFLQEIPSGFADITTLALIQLNYCRDSVLASAKWIQDEQHNNYGNDALFVRSENIWQTSQKEGCDDEEARE